MGLNGGLIRQRFVTVTRDTRDIVIIIIITIIIIIVVVVIKAFSPVFKRIARSVARLQNRSIAIEPPFF